jgi:hypothetical protein
MKTTASSEPLAFGALRVDAMRRMSCGGRPEIINAWLPTELRSPSFSIVGLSVLGLKQPIADVLGDN